MDVSNVHLIEPEYDDRYNQLDHERFFFENRWLDRIIEGVQAGESLRLVALRMAETMHIPADTVWNEADWQGLERWVRLRIVARAGIATNNLIEAAAIGAVATNAPTFVVPLPVTPPTVTVATVVVDTRYRYMDYFIDALIVRITEGDLVVTPQLLQDEASITSGWTEGDAIYLRELIHARAVRMSNILPPSASLQHVTLGIVMVGGRMTLAPEFAAAMPRVKVHIRRLANSGWSMSVKVNGVSKNWPRTAEFRQYLPRELRAHVRRSNNRYDSEEICKTALTNGLVSANVMADAVKAYFAAQLDIVTEATAIMGQAEDDAALMRLQPATLLAGGVAYRLVPVGGADLRNPLRDIRQRARAAAQAEAESVRLRAVNDSALVVRNAEARAATIRAEIEQERRRAIRNVPEWFLRMNRPFYADTENRQLWHIVLKVGTVIEQVQMNVPHWNKTLYWNRVEPPNFIPGSRWLNVRLTIDSEGRYSMDSCASWDGVHAPHVAGRVCMELQALPLRVNSTEALTQLEQGLTRGMRVINMNSLLERHIETWHPYVLAQVPQAIANMLKNPTRYPEPRYTQRAQTEWPAELRNWDNEVENAEEARLIFRT